MVLIFAKGDYERPITYDVYQVLVVFSIRTAVCRKRLLAGTNSEFVVKCTVSCSFGFKMNSRETSGETGRNCTLDVLIILIKFLTNCVYVWRVTRVVDKLVRIMCVLCTLVDY